MSSGGCDARLLVEGSRRPLREAEAEAELARDYLALEVLDERREDGA